MKNHIRVVRCFVSLLLGMLLCSSFVYAEESSSYNDIVAISPMQGDTDKLILISQEDNCKYFLENSKIIKLEEVKRDVENRTIYIEEEGTQGKIVTNIVEIAVYESARLTDREIGLLRAGELVSSNQAMNSMGNVRITLSIRYSGTGINFRLISASSSYEILNSGEGVIPRTSRLEWGALGDIYNNGSFFRRGELGNLITYSTPSFSNVQLMPSGQTIDAVHAGATYTLYCTRGVTIPVSVTVVWS
ncbi:MAG: hypothetical protein Q4B85_03595 [Lachnospiraceae bacterium]|nr:hypothetical protein [Lachnospiraceae bacterium]